MVLASAAQNNTDPLMDLLSYLFKIIINSEISNCGMGFWGFV